MNKSWILLKNQLLNSSRLWEIRAPGSTKKTSAILLVFGMVSILLFFCAYNTLTALALVSMNQQDLIPSYLVAVSSFALFFLTLFRSKGILLASKDTEMLWALPVKSSDILISRLLLLYLMNVVLGWSFLIPGGIIWLSSGRIHPFVGFLYLAASFFLPLIPMCASSSFSFVILLLSARFKNKTAFSLIFSFLALGFIGYLIRHSLDSTQPANSIGASLASQISGIYPLAKGFFHSNPLILSLNILWFMLLSLLVFYLFVKIISTYYWKLNTRTAAFNNHPKTDWQSITQKRRSPSWALYRKELGQYFNSYTAVFNTSLGVVLLCIYSLGLLLSSPQQASNFMGITNRSPSMIQYSPIVIAALLSMSCPATSSVSLEGKCIWILQSSPISVPSIINSKIAVNLSLHAVGYLFAVFAFLAKYRMTPFEILHLLLIPVIYSLFTSVLGIFLNLKFPNYDWDHEVIVVKQSIPVLMGGIASMMAIAVPVFIHWFFKFYLVKILWMTASLLLVLTLFLYGRICKSKFIGEESL